MDWDPAFFERSPMFEALRRHAEPLRNRADWPSRAALSRLLAARGVRTASGLPLAPVAPAGEPYELALHARGEMQHRERNWHDLLNALVWLAYPRTKAALNAAHVAGVQEERAAAVKGAAAPQRGRVRDALTLFDESGAIVVSSDPAVLEDIRAHRWKGVFWERRAAFRRCAHAFLFGHALFEKSLAPYVGMTAHALLLQVGEDFPDSVEAVDAAAAARIASLDTPQSLSPLPVLGVPGWWPANERVAFYDNERYFRPSRRPG